MTGGTVIRSTPLDEFLNESSSSTAIGELLQRIGLTGSLLGITLSIGLIAFLAVVHTGRRSEIVTMIRIIRAAGVLAMLGAAVELAGLASIGDLSWSQALTDPTGSAPMMRLLAGLLIVFGLFDQTVSVGDPGDVAPADAETHSTWVPVATSAFAIVGLTVGAMSFWFDGHTVTEGPRVVHAVVDLVHVTAGGVWLGGIVGLVVVGALRRGTGESMASVLIRFARIAAAAVVGAVLAGTSMTLMIVDGPGDLISTDWGRLLLVKTGVVAVVAGIGGYHHFVVVPALRREAPTPADVARTRITVGIEAVLLVCVVAVTVLVTTASTN